MSGSDMLRIKESKKGESNCCCMVLCSKYIFFARERLCQSLSMKKQLKILTFTRGQCIRYFFTTPQQISDCSLCPNLSAGDPVQEAIEERREPFKKCDRRCQGQEHVQGCRQSQNKRDQGQNQKHDQASCHQK